MDPTKSGVKTTEFVLSLMPWLAFLLVAGLVAAGLLDDQYVMIIFTALGLGGGYSTGKYAESRATIKKATLGDLE